MGQKGGGGGLVGGGGDDDDAATAEEAAVLVTIASACSTGSDRRDLFARRVRTDAGAVSSAAHVRQASHTTRSTWQVALDQMPQSRIPQLRMAGRPPKLLERMRRQPVAAGHGRPKPHRVARVSATVRMRRAAARGPRVRCRWRTRCSPRRSPAARSIYASAARPARACYAPAPPDAAERNRLMTPSKQDRHDTPAVRWRRR